MPSQDGTSPSPDTSLDDFRRSVLTYLAGHEFGQIPYSGRYNIEVNYEPSSGSIYITVEDAFVDFFGTPQAPQDGCWVYTVPSTGSLPNQVEFSPGDRGESLLAKPLNEAPLNWQELKLALDSSKREANPMDLLSLVQEQAPGCVGYDMRVTPSAVIEATRRLLLEASHPAGTDILPSSIYWHDALGLLGFQQKLLVRHGYEQQFSSGEATRPLPDSLRALIGTMMVSPAITIHYQGVEHMVVGIISDPQHRLKNGQTVKGTNIIAVYLLDCGYLEQ